MADVKFIRDITALLVIDPYNDFISEGGQFWPHVKSVAEATSGSKHLYLKLRARASYEFASASAAIMLTISSGNITRARIVACGVGTKPWRSPEAEAALVGKPVNDVTVRRG